ncbi:MAG: di-heme-cytochrome C peroxidase [Limisphaerales bacterium]
MHSPAPHLRPAAVLEPLILAVSALLFAGCGRDGSPANDLPPVAVSSNITWLPTGLSAAEQKTWHTLGEGSEVLPMVVLEVLKSPLTGRSFLESLGAYGFLTTSTNAHEPPIGITVATQDVLGHQLPFIGVNCAACHTGEIQYQGQSLRMDGAPNLFSMEDLFRDAHKALEDVLADPVRAFEFVRSVIRRHHDEAKPGEFLEVTGAAFDFLNSVNLDDGVSAPEQVITAALGAAASPLLDYKADAVASGGLNAAKLGLLGDLSSTFERYSGFLERRLERLRVMADAIDCGVDMGPGRGDSFGIIRDLLYPDHGIELDAPVSTPHLFGLGGFQWIHWDGNTTSVMDRNYAQAIALGADYDATTHASSVQPLNLDRLEQVARKIQPPAWPTNVLGPLDPAKLALGKSLYADHCARCHTEERVYPYAEVGTSLPRTTNVMGRVGGRHFYMRLAGSASNILAASYAAHGITPEQARSFERVPDPAWRTTGGYVARKLDGVWASPPYLHNGSVPTLHDLLLPVAQRPKTFPVGHREFDPRKVGFITDVAAPVWTMDTTIPGNFNHGHEFGTQLSEDDRWALIEYVKSL